MPIHQWFEPHGHTTAEAVPYPLPKNVVLKKPTNAVRDAVGDLLLQEGV